MPLLGIPCSNIFSKTKYWKKERGSREQLLISKNVYNLFIKKNLTGINNQFLNRLITCMHLIQVLRIRFDSQQRPYEIKPDTCKCIYSFIKHNKIKCFFFIIIRVIKILHNGGDVPVWILTISWYRYDDQFHIDG